MKNFVPHFVFSSLNRNFAVKPLFGANDEC